MGIFGPQSPPLPSTPAPSPLDPPQQNDFREQRVTADAERATWAKVNSARTPAVKAGAVVELVPDEWVPITVPVGSIGTTPALLMGDDRARRRAVLTNIGTEDLQLATDSGKFGTDPTTLAASVFILKAAATITLTTTRALFVRAPVGTAGGITLYVERGTRDQ